MTRDRTGAARWQFWIDRGGTFTDIVGSVPTARSTTLKLLSENPEHYRDAAVAGHPPPARPRRRTRRSPSAEVESVKMGTTVATNALLERKGEPTLLVTTRGFRDALRIAYQNRPRLFERRIVLPELLYARVVEADERMSARTARSSGRSTRRGSRPTLRAAFADRHARASRSCFMHG